MIKGCQQYDWQPVWASLPEPLRPPVLTGVTEAGLIRFSCTSSQLSLANLRGFPFPCPASWPAWPALPVWSLFFCKHHSDTRDTMSVCCYVQQPFVWAKQRQSRVVKWSDATTNCIHRIFHSGNTRGKKWYPKVKPKTSHYQSLVMTASLFRFSSRL